MLALILKLIRNLNKLKDLSNISEFQSLKKLLANAEIKWYPLQRKIRITHGETEITVTISDQILFNELWNLYMEFVRQDKK